MSSQERMTKHAAGITPELAGLIPVFTTLYHLHTFIDLSGRAPSAHCPKRTSPHAHCPVCPPLFSSLARSKDGVRFTTLTPSPRAFSSWILHALQLIGADTRAFSGVSARRGGLSTAIEAGVPEVILWMQSGHAQSRAARSYITLNSPSLLYKTWEAFEL